MKLLMIMAVLLALNTACEKVESITKETIQQRIEIAKNEVQKTFLTPESVSFQNIYYNVKWQAVCGWIKHKNSYGSYTEFNKFIYTDDNFTERFLYADKEDSYFVDMWNEVCGKTE